MLTSDISEIYDILSGIIGIKLHTHEIAPAILICRAVVGNEIGFEVADKLVKRFQDACVVDGKCNMESYKAWKWHKDKDKIYEIPSLNEEDRKKAVDQIKDYADNLFSGKDVIKVVLYDEV